MRRLPTSKMAMSFSVLGLGYAGYLVRIYVFFCIGVYFTRSVWLPLVCLVCVAHLIDESTSHTTYLCVRI